MDDRLKRWPTLPRRDPCLLLRELLELIAKGARHGIKRDLLLRGPKQKKSREIFQACIFLCAVREASGKPYIRSVGSGENGMIQRSNREQNREHRPFWPYQGFSELTQSCRMPIHCARSSAG